MTTCLALGVLGSTHAQDKAPPPPYLISGGHHYLVGVTWNEEALKLLPAGLKATPERTGAINIYQAERGYGVSPYQSGYAWIDVEGHDSADGTKARYILKSGIGPENSYVALSALFRSDAVLGGTQLEDGDVKRGIGIRKGQPWVQIEIKSSGECQPVAGTLNYPISAAQMIQIPYAAEACTAEPVSAKIMLPNGEKGAALQPTKLLWAAELKDTRFAFTNPVTMK
jgi:hypothetical protein